jgi:hypothetical protein
MYAVRTISFERLFTAQMREIDWNGWKLCMSLDSVFMQLWVRGSCLRSGWVKLTIRIKNHILNTSKIAAISF